MRTDRILGVVSLLLLSVSGCNGIEQDPGAPDDEALGETQDALTDSVLAYANAGGMVQSTGNLYWTTNLADYKVGPYHARVYRASKSNTPGSEVLLYSEDSTSSVKFGAITWALTSDYYGYFVANYASGSQIDRIPLAPGGSVTHLTPVGNHINYNTLVNDGTYLYWADEYGIRKMPLAGGTPVTLVSGGGIRSVGLDAGTVYFTIGQSLFSVLKGGGAVTYLQTTNTGGYINAISVWSALGAPTVVYWAQEDREIIKYVVGGEQFIQEMVDPRYRSTSVYFDGTNLAWTQCTANQCQAKVRQTGGGAIGSAVQAGGNYIQTDGAAMYWAAATHIEKTAY